MYLLSLAAWGVGSVIFGLQRTLAGIIIGRWLGEFHRLLQSGRAMIDEIVGMNAGPGLLSCTMMCEITDESNIVQGKFSERPLCGAAALPQTDQTGFAVFSPANVFGHTIGCVRHRTSQNYAFILTACH